MTDIAFIRCHRFGDDERKLAQQLSLFFGQEHVAVCIDETRGEADTHPWKKAVLTRDKARDLVGGPVPDDWGWRMGDLCHLAIAEAFPGYERQWLLESDIHIPAGHEKEIFEELSAIDAEFMACALMPKKVKPIAAAVGLVLPSVEWGCVFAFNRLSTRCVPDLRQLRQDISAAMRASSKGFKAPNDEAVVSNLCFARGWKMVDLWDVAPDIFSRKWFDTNPPWLRRDLEERVATRRVSHPVLDVHQLLRRIGAEGDGHPQLYKSGRLSRILPHLTEDESAQIIPLLKKNDAARNRG